MARWLAGEQEAAGIVPWNGLVDLRTSANCSRLMEPRLEHGAQEAAGWAARQALGEGGLEFLSRVVRRVERLVVLHHRFSSDG